MSKNEGKIIIVKFTEKITTDPTGSEIAFLVTGDEYKYVDGPYNNGPLISKEYLINSVTNHPIEQKAISLNIKPFNNSVGGLTVKYNSSIGNLGGLGGSILDFEKIFIPTDLVITPFNVGTHENLSSNVGAIISLLKLVFSKAYATEHLTANVSSIIGLYKLDDAPL